jgi:RNA polymerase sigma-70 factor (ECF subfamily)
MNPASKVLDIAVALSSGSERELLDRFRQGDTDAFSALYRDYSPAVFRFALYMTGDHGKAAEITQDAFVWLIRHPDKFDSERGNLAAFLAGVARQCIRRQQRTELRWLPFDRATGMQAVSAIDPINAIDAEALLKAVALLPLRYREAVVLCDLEGHTFEQAAKVLNCAVGTIHSRVHRAHQLLARKFYRRADP